MSDSSQFVWPTYHSRKESAQWCTAIPPSPAWFTTASAVVGDPQLSPDRRGKITGGVQTPQVDADPDGYLAGQIAPPRQVLDARAVIEQAKQMLMASLRITSNQAFTLLRRESQYTAIKVRDVAARYVLLHSTPDRPHPPR